MTKNPKTPLLPMTEQGLNIPEPPVLPPAVMTFITPAMAAQWLSNLAKQRKLSPSRVKLYAIEFIAGWLGSYDPVCFNTCGELANAMHRMSGLVLAGKSGCPGAWLLVARDVPDDVLRKMDIGKPRGLGDRMAMLGELPAATASRITAIAKAMRNGIQAVKGDTDTYSWELARRYCAVIQSVDRHFAGHPRHIGCAAVVGTFVRAHVATSGEVDSTLARGAEILVTGLCDPHVPGERTMIALRDSLHRSPRSGGSSNLWISRMTSRAIRALLDQENIKHLRPTTQNYFPIPEDADQDPV